MVSRIVTWRGAAGPLQLVGWAALLWLGAAGCEPEPPRSQPRARAAPPAPPSAQRSCPGGLLCEAKATLLGWRLPQGCDQRQVRPHLATCVLQGVQWQRLVEFYRSRYPRVDAKEGRLKVVGPSPGPGRTPPMLRALQRGAHLELLLLPGDPALPVPQAPAVMQGSVR